LKEVTTFIKSFNSVPAIQLAHAGRKASCFAPFYTPGRHEQLAGPEDGGWGDDIVAPSVLQNMPCAGVPREMSLQDIEDVKKAFVEATRRSDEAGFDVVEIHSAHGYAVVQRMFFLYSSEC
jgi:2,4-dienoyl-CoA reductase-like NADH-dependent reductase (Old Yellow Enzyme family)